MAALDPRPDVVMFQEANRRCIDLVCSRAGLGWRHVAAEIRTAEETDTPVRQRGVALAGTGPAPASAEILHDVPLPERTIHASVELGGVETRVASYHAPPGVTWFEKKPQQAVAFARWLAAQGGRVLFGADANTPEVDHPDFSSTRTHWHSGHSRLDGQPGDDLLWAESKAHHLQDALRVWLRENDEVAADLAAANPSGPLAITHRTGRRKASPGTARRYDCVWISDHFTVEAIDHPYEESVAAGSDHSAVVVDLGVRA